MMAGMKSCVRLLLAGLGAGALTLSAQTIYSDTFATDSGNWGTDVTAVGGAFVRNGVLNFTDGGLTTGQTSYAYRDYQISASAAADWQVQVDFTLGLASQVESQVTMWTLYASALTANPPNDYLKAELNQNYMQTGYRILNSTLYKDNSTVASENLGSLTAGSAIALQIAYSATGKTLTLGYDADAGTGGYSFTTLHTADINTWALNATDDFGFRIQASNTVNGGTSAAITSGETFADNFSLTTAAIPEPAAAGVLLGALGLLAALRRRAS